MIIPRAGLGIQPRRSWCRISEREREIARARPDGCRLPTRVGAGYLGERKCSSIAPATLLALHRKRKKSMKEEERREKKEEEEEEEEVSELAPKRRLTWTDRNSEIRTPQ